MSSGFGLFHISARKRIQKDSASFPHPHFWKGTFDRAMYGIGLLAPLALLPQVLELFASHNVASFSLSTWIVLGCISACWTLYGLIHKEPALMLANLFTGVLNFSVVIAILLYSGHP